MATSLNSTSVQYASKASPRNRWRVFCIVGGFIVVPALLAAPSLLANRERTARRNTGKSFGSVVVGLQHYNETYGHLPEPIVLTEDGDDWYSWRCSIHPFVFHS